MKQSFVLFEFTLLKEFHEATKLIVATTHELENVGHMLLFYTSKG